MATRDITDQQVIRAYERYKAENDPWQRPVLWPYDFLMEETGQPFKVCWRAMERACDRGFIEYGTSLRSGWITEKGKSLLSQTQLQKSGTGLC